MGGCSPPRGPDRARSAQKNRRRSRYIDEQVPLSAWGPAGRAQARRELASKGAIVRRPPSGPLSMLAATIWWSSFMPSFARLIFAMYVVGLGCGSVTARTDGSASGGASGTDAGAGTGGAGTGGRGGAAGAGSCHVELLTNGNFESGNVGWTASPSDRRLIYLFGEVNPTVVPPTVSDYIAWLGYDVVSQTVVLSQTIQI